MRNIILSILFSAVATTAAAQNQLYSNEFPLGDVTLLDGPLKHARDLNIETLLKYDCDRLLAPYRKEAGLEPKAKAYPNWDGLDGHVGGHYLTAMAINAATGSNECRQRMEYMIGELQQCADANNKNHPSWGQGYVGGMPGRNYAAEQLKKRENVDNFVDRAVDMKLTEVLKTVVKLEEKPVSLEEFNKLMERK